MAAEVSVRAVGCWSVYWGGFAGLVSTMSQKWMCRLGLTPFRGHRLSGLGGRGDELVLEGYWADLAQRAVPPAVVDSLDPGA